MSLILSIETSGKTCSVSLSKEGLTIDFIDVHPEGYVHAEQLNVCIQDLMSRNHLEMKELKAICVSSGPGSYTGLRIGVASAKGLCYGLGIPLISIDALTIMQEKITETKLGTFDFYIPMIDARRMEVYMSIFNNVGTCLQQPKPEIISETTFDALTGDILLYGDGADKLGSLNFSKNISFEKNFKTSAASMSRIAFTKFENKKFEDVAYFDPIYLKEFNSGK